MDHTPGQGQFHDFAAYAAFHSRAYGKTEAELRAEVDAKHATAVLTAGHLERLAEAAAKAGCALAWHDPDSAEAVAAAAALGASIAEFPTTLAAAEAARALGLAVVMGAPNLLRGVSSTNNLTAAQALSAGCLDGLVSDYYPEAIWPAALGAGSLSAAVALAAGAPAMAAGLTDRGALEVGRRADLVALSERGRVLAVVRGGREWGNCHR
jgi:alpha-D-ribose 1-methylphosphonate 5-triphosphate diphosphatase